MSELKTLKDIIPEHSDMNGDIDVGFAIDILKQEAIKHWKKEMSTECHDEPKSAYDWIEEFFNLTPEDLKND